MATKKQCAGVIGNPKDPRKGNPCSRYAVNGSDMCAVHGGSIKVATATASDLANRCVHKASSTGDRCKKSAIKGGTVCKSHGGAARHVAKKARERLLELQEPAIVQLNRILSAPGTSDSDRLRAVQMVLDRTGLGASQHVEVEVKPWEITMQQVFKNNVDPQINRGIPADMLEELNASKTTARDENIEDAEVIEDDDFEPSDHSNVVSFDAPVRRGSANPPRRR